MNAPWYEALLSDARDVVGQLLDEQLVPSDALREEVERYHAHVVADAGPMTDVQSADALRAATLSLLEQTSAAPEHRRRLAQVAARYFVLENDGEDDLRSPYGFDDDVEVFNAVVHALGHPELEIGY